MNDLLNMLITLLDARDAQGVANVDFQFSKILEMISPKKIMEDIRQVRRKFSIHMGNIWSWMMEIPNVWI